MPAASAHPDHTTACCARSSPIVGSLLCRRGADHRGAHMASLRSGATYCWYDGHDTVKHGDSPCECGEPRKAHRAPEGKCPNRDGQFRAAELPK